MKGFFKFISQIFETEKEQEIEIGLPTDVKHVAHIGWDGPSVNSPSWMKDFKASPGLTSVPSNLTGDVQNKVSEDSKRRSTREVSELPPKASKRQSAGAETDSPTREKSSKTRQSRKSTNKTKDESNPTQIPAASPDSLPDIPKKSRRKSKESSNAGVSKSKSKAQPDSDPGSPTQSNSRTKPTSFDENEPDLFI